MIDIESINIDIKIIYALCVLFSGFVIFVMIKGVFIPWISLITNGLKNGKIKKMQQGVIPTIEIMGKVEDIRPVVDTDGVIEGFYILAKGINSISQQEMIFQSQRFYYTDAGAKRGDIKRCKEYVYTYVKKGDKVTIHLHVSNPKICYMDVVVPVEKPEKDDLE